MQINALFHEYDGAQELLAVGEYTAPDPGGWQDGKRSEPPMDAHIRLTAVTTPEGGDIDWGDEMEHEALAALWREAECMGLEK